MFVKNAGKSIKYFAAGFMILVWYQIKVCAFFFIILLTANDVDRMFSQITLQLYLK